MHQHPGTIYFLYKYNQGYDSDPIQIHFLCVARVHKPALNYNGIITNCVQRLSYIHAYTKIKQKTLHFDIAATGDLGKRSLLGHSETLTGQS